MAQTNANLIWKIADLLRGPYQPNQYGEPSQGPVATMWPRSTANV
jgi:hypothetical protein